MGRPRQRSVGLGGIGGGIDRDQPSLRSEYHFRSSRSHMLHYAPHVTRIDCFKSHLSTDGFGRTPPTTTANTGQGSAVLTAFTPGITPNGGGRGERHLSDLGPAVVNSTTSV